MKPGARGLREDLGPRTFEEQANDGKVDVWVVMEGYRMESTCRNIEVVGGEGKTEEADEGRAEMNVQGRTWRSCSCLV